MNKLKRRLVGEAVSRYGNIRPTITAMTLNSCFSVEDSKLLFWFNDEGGNTRVIHEDQLETISS